MNIGVVVESFREPLFQALETAFNLRLLFFFFHREEDIDTKHQTHCECDDTHWPNGDQPVGIAEVATAGEACDERDGQQVSAAAGIESVGTDIHLEKVLYHEVAPKVVAMVARGSVDSANCHENRQHDGGFHRGG